MLICRNEYFIGTHIYTRSGMLIRSLSALPTTAVKLFIVLAGNQIADYALVKCRCQDGWRASRSTSSGRTHHGNQADLLVF
jgi:hypothetical protein